MTSQLIEHVAKRIREFRTSYGGGTGISQEALAEALGVASNTISRWETATYRPTIEDLERLCPRWCFRDAGPSTAPNV